MRKPEACSLSHVSDQKHVPKLPAPMSSAASVKASTSTKPTMLHAGSLEAMYGSMVGQIDMSIPNISFVSGQASSEFSSTLIASLDGAVESCEAPSRGEETLVPVVGMAIGVLFAEFAEISSSVGLHGGTTGDEHVDGDSDVCDGREPQSELDIALDTSENLPGLSSDEHGLTTPPLIRAPSTPGKLSSRSIGTSEKSLGEGTQLEAGLLLLRRASRASSRISPNTSSSSVESVTSSLMCWVGSRPGLIGLGTLGNQLLSWPKPLTSYPP